MSLKEDLLREISRFQKTANEIDKVDRKVNHKVIDSVKLDHKELQTVKVKARENLQSFKGTLREIKESVQKLVKTLDFIKNLEWDVLNVAFFGETNAGKSTLIEALIKGDGTTIGDGRKDFTKDINSMQFGNKIRILDMPGIEGDEGKVKTEIWKAVNKAHVIFYVYPDTKEPERETLKKISRYLRKNAEVYAVLNLRGVFPSNVLEQKRRNAKIIAKRSDGHLKNVLGRAYRGSIVVHALYGFFGRARQVPGKLQSQYANAVRFFGSKRKLEELSGVKEIVNKIEELAQNQDSRILWSNVKKVIVTQQEVTGKLLSWKKNFDVRVKEIRNDIESLKKKIKNDKSALERRLQGLLIAKTEELENKLTTIVYEGIDKNWSESKIKKEMQNQVEKFKKELQAEFKRRINSFKRRVLEDIENLQERFMVKSELNPSFELSEVLSKLTEISFGDLVGFGSIMGSLVMLLLDVLNPLFAIAHIFLSILGMLFSGDSKRERAKREAKKHVKSAVKDIRLKLTGELKKVSQEIEKQFKKVERKLNGITRELRSVSRGLDPIIKEFLKSNVRVSMLFFKQIDNGVKFASIQIIGSRERKRIIAAVVTPNPYRLDLELSGFNDVEVYVYSSLEKLKSKISRAKSRLTSGRDVKSEFFKRIERALNAY